MLSVCSPRHYTGVQTQHLPQTCAVPKAVPSGKLSAQSPRELNDFQLQGGTRVSEGRYRWRVSRSVNAALQLRSQNLPSSEGCCSWRKFCIWNMLFTAGGQRVFSWHGENQLLRTIITILCISTKKKWKKNQTTQILNPPFSSFNGLFVNAKQKEVTERKAYKMDALPAAENHSLALVHGAILWAARGLSQPRIEVIFRTRWVFRFRI